MKLKLDPFAKNGLSQVNVAPVITGVSTSTSSGGGVQSVVAGTNVTVDNTDPSNPIVSSTGGGSTSAADVSYDDTNIQTPTQGLVQADDVQEVIDDFITIFAPYVTILFGRVPPSGGTTGQVLTKDTGTDYDFSWQDSSGGSTGYAWQDYEKTATYVYVGYEESGGAWYIYRRTIATNVRMYATGASGYAAAWTARSSQTYS